jgi:hypothetical protein
MVPRLHGTTASWHQGFLALIHYGYVILPRAWGLRIAEDCRLFWFEVPKNGLQLEQRTMNPA